jgi:hypothetical protein
MRLYSSTRRGAQQAVRYQMTPERVVHLAAADVAKQRPNFLMDALPERLKRGPVKVFFWTPGIVSPRPGLFSSD